MSLATPEKIQTPQRKLCLRAKRSSHAHCGQSRGTSIPRRIHLRHHERHQPHTAACDSRTPSERTWSESRMREIRTSGSMSGIWKRSKAMLLRHRQTKGPETDRLNLNHRATSLLYEPTVIHYQ